MFIWLEYGDWSIYKSSYFCWLTCITCLQSIFIPTFLPLYVDLVHGCAVYLALYMPCDRVYFYQGVDSGITFPIADRNVLLILVQCSGFYTLKNHGIWNRTCDVTTVKLDLSMVHDEVTFSLSPTLTGNSLQRQVLWYSHKCSMACKVNRIIIQMLVRFVCLKNENKKTCKSVG